MPDSARQRFGLFDFDPSSRELRREGALVRLQAQPAQVLALLLAKPGEIVTRETLCRAVWGTETFVDFDRSLNFCVAQIRSALGDSAESPRYIKTLPKRGYQFIAPVSKPAGAELAGAEPAVPMSRKRWILPAAVSTAALASAGILLFLHPFGAGHSSPIRVAIARFDNQTGNPAYDSFAEGVTDTLVAEMTNAGSGKLAVIGNAAILRIPREKRDLAAIAASVNASYVVLGQVQQSPAGTRVLAHLIRLPDGAHVKVVRLDPAMPQDLNDFGASFAKRVAQDFPQRIVNDLPSRNRQVHESTGK